jgi:hypothetical protein
MDQQDLNNRSRAFSPSTNSASGRHRQNATYAEIKAGGFSEEVWEAHIHYHK